MEKEYYILIDGQKIPVTEEVYRAYKQPVWRESKRAKVRAELEYSYDGMLEDGMEVASDELVEDIVADKLLLDTLLAELSELTEDDRSIDALFYQVISERDLSKKTGVAQTAINYQKKRILAWLKNKL